MWQYIFIFVCIKASLLLVFVIALNDNADLLIFGFYLFIYLFIYLYIYLIILFYFVYFLIYLLVLLLLSGDSS